MGVGVGGFVGCRGVEHVEIGVGGFVGFEGKGVGRVESCEEGHVGRLVERFDNMAVHKSIEHVCEYAHGSSVAIDDVTTITTTVNNNK